MPMSARLFMRSWAIDEHKYNFISFNLEKLRSALATVTESVQNRMHAVPSCGIDDRTSDDTSSLKISFTDLQFLISALNSRRNARMLGLLKQDLLPNQLSRPCAGFLLWTPTVHQKVLTLCWGKENRIAEQPVVVLQNAILIVLLAHQQDC